MGRCAWGSDDREAYHVRCVRVEPLITATVLQTTATVARVELVDIYTTYYWLHPAQAIPEHEEVAH